MAPQLPPTPAASSICHLPLSRNQYFAGRQRVLELLAKALAADNGGRVQVIYGAGGVGKTHLALEYAYCWRDGYPLIWWLPADEASTLAAHFAALAEHLGLYAILAAGADEIRKAVLRELEGRENWLLIFDNAVSADLATAQAACGPRHPLVASIRTNLGIALRLQGRSDAALAELERAAALGESVMGPDHVEVGRSLAHLGSLYQERGDLLAARRCFQRSLDIQERTFGASHLLLIEHLNNLGRCLKQLEDVDGSAACYERAAAILRQSREQTTSQLVVGGV